MQLGDSSFTHSDIMNFTNKTFELYFKENIQFLKCSYSNEAMGWFLLEYIYIPTGYKVLFENARLCFSIRIIDDDGSYTSLFRMIDSVKLSNVLEKENIDKAIKILSKELKKENICFYISRDDKQYKKVDGKFIRIKYPFMK